MREKRKRYSSFRANHLKQQYILTHTHVQQVDKEKASEGNAEKDSGDQKDAKPVQEPTLKSDLHAGLVSILPGETEKQRLRRLKRELKDELHDRKRKGKAEAKLSLLELVASKGYPIEEHKVTTPDGYILTVHRIPYSKNETEFSPR